MQGRAEYLQKINEQVEFFKTISAAVDASLASLDQRPEPFCILCLVYKNNVPSDIAMIGYNVAFHKFVNKTIRHGQLFSECAPDIVKYWLKPLLMVEVTGQKIQLNDYVSYGENRLYGKVALFQVNLLGKKGVGLVFEEPKGLGVCKWNLCLSCPNNPTAIETKTKLTRIRVRVDDSLNISNCEACQKLQKFLNADSLLR